MHLTIDNSNDEVLLAALRRALDQLTTGSLLTISLADPSLAGDLVYFLEHMGFGNVRLQHSSQLSTATARKMGTFSDARIKRIWPAHFSEPAVCSKVNSAKVTVVITPSHNKRELIETIAALESQECHDWEARVLGNTLPPTLLSHPKVKNAETPDAKGEYVIELRAGDKLHQQFISRALSLLEADVSLGFIYSHVFSDSECPRLVYLPLASQKIKPSEIKPVPALFRQRTWRAARETAKTSALTKPFWEKLDKEKGTLIPEPLCIVCDHTK